MEEDLQVYSHEAMNTEFRIFFPKSEVSFEEGDSLAILAWNELDSLEADLSRYRSGSDISRMNQLALEETTKISMATFDCLNLAEVIREETNGAFNIAIGALMDVAREVRPLFMHQDKSKWGEAGEKVVSGAFKVDENDLSVTRLVEEVTLDLGGIGKGYALDQLAVLLEQNGVANFLMDAGESTYYGVGGFAGNKGWPVGVGDDRVFLNHSASSGSGLQIKGSHIMNPIEKRPISAQSSITWAVAPTAAMSDALSTAFIVMDEEEIDKICSRYDDISCFRS